MLQPSLQSRTPPQHVQQATPETLPPACCSHKPPPPLPTQLSASHRYQAAFRIMLNMNEASQLGPVKPLPCFVSDFCTSVVLSPSWQPGKCSVPEHLCVPTSGRRRGFHMQFLSSAVLRLSGEFPKYAPYIAFQHAAVSVVSRLGSLSPYVHPNQSGVSLHTWLQDLGSAPGSSA